MRHLLLGAVSAAAVIAAAPAFAQDGAVLATATVGELVVTANRSPQAAERVGQSVTVLDAAEIKESQAVIASDLLSRTPGVSYSRNGGVGGATSLRIRGAETDQSVVVIDGVKLNDPASTGGGYNFTNLLIGDIDRIEVLRGAQSTLWGSQAIGGVIAVTTASPKRPLEGDLQIEGGSFGTLYGRGAVGGTSEHLDWRVGASRYQTDGVSAYVRGTEDDGYENTGVNGRAVVKLSGALSVDLRAVYSDSKNDFDGFPAPAFVFADSPEYGRTKEFVGYAGVNLDLLDGALKNRVAYGFTRTDRDQFNPNQPVTQKTFDALGENKRWEYQGVWQVAPAWVATFGAETEDQSMRSASPSQFDPNPTPIRGKAKLDSFYAQIQGQVVDGLTVTGGVRQDSHDTFGDHTLGQLAAAWALNSDNTILRASWGQGFKAPSLYQLFSQYGNTGLDPEEADGWDAGIEQHLVDGRIVVSATYFERETENQIDFFSCFGNPNASPLCRVNGAPRDGFYYNVGQAKAHGVELEGTADLGPFDIEANYTFSRAENDTPGSVNRGKLLTRRPEHTANLTFSYDWTSGFQAAAAIRYVGDSFDNVGNTYVLQSYTLLDLRASYPVTDQIEVYGRIENAFDDNYETTRNYGYVGRGVYAGARARF